MSYLHFDTFCENTLDLLPYERYEEMLCDNRDAMIVDNWDEDEIAGANEALEQLRAAANKDAGYGWVELTYGFPEERTESLNLGGMTTREAMNALAEWLLSLPNITEDNEFLGITSQGEIEIA